jgi:hypothetical protein
MTVVLGAAIEALNTLSADIIAGNQAPSIYSRCESFPVYDATCAKPLSRRL